MPPRIGTGGSHGWMPSLIPSSSAMGVMMFGFVLAITLVITRLMKRERLEY